MNVILDQTLALHSFRTGQAAGPKIEASPKVESYRHDAEAAGAPAGTPLRGDVKSAPEPSGVTDGTPVPAYMRAPEHHLRLPRHMASMTPIQPRPQQKCTPEERTQRWLLGATAYSLALGRTDRLCKVSWC
jgi:hypothetical protein